MVMVRCLQPLESSVILGHLRFGDDGYDVFMIVLMITTMMIIDSYDHHDNHGHDDDAS